MPDRGRACLAVGPGMLPLKPAAGTARRGCTRPGHTRARCAESLVTSGRVRPGRAAQLVSIAAFLGDLTGGFVARARRSGASRALESARRPSTDGVGVPGQCRTCAAYARRARRRPVPPGDQEHRRERLAGGRLGDRADICDDKPDSALQSGAALRCDGGEHGVTAGVWRQAPGGELRGRHGGRTVDLDAVGGTTAGT